LARWQDHKFMYLTVVVVPSCRLRVEGTGW